PRPLVFVRDLEEFDGPILSEYKTEDGSLYLEKWCDRDEDHGLIRTMVVRTERRPLAEYLASRISMYDLLVGPSDGVGFIMDRHAADVHRISVALLADLPPMYLPQHNAFHDMALRPPWDTWPQSFLLDEDWDAKLLAKSE